MIETQISDSYRRALKGFVTFIRRSDATSIEGSALLEGEEH